LADAVSLAFFVLCRINYNSRRVSLLSNSLTKRITMPVIGIDHVQLAMPAGGEDQARAFYGQVLGLPETPKPPELARRGGCWFESDRVKIHLGVDASFHPARKAHPGLLVTDLKQIVARCRERGFDTSADAPLPGYDRIFLEDPFGNRLELMEQI
jgi:catechol 2,3-dioxygenase-like lactoylglutathione lyase family enzyme